MNKFSLLIFLFLSTPLLSAVPTCTENNEKLLEDFVPTDFAKDRKTVGRDQVDPLLSKASAYILNQPDIVITEIEITAQTARAPYYKVVGRKKVLDPQSDEINSSLAKQRSEFAQSAFIEMFKMKKIAIAVKSQLSGPEFDPKDLNLRFITPESQGYKEKVTQLFQTNKDAYEKDALIKSVGDLEKESNLYHAKFKPFQGFKLVLTGYKKCLKPLDLSHDHKVETR